MRQSTAEVAGVAIVAKMETSGKIQQTLATSAAVRNRDISFLIYRRLSCRFNEPLSLAEFENVGFRYSKTTDLHCLLHRVYYCFFPSEGVVKNPF
jgi:hypothetical protein